jgi:hypothetical protein
VVVLLGLYAIGFGVALVALAMRLRRLGGGIRGPAAA